MKTVRYHFMGIGFMVLSALLMMPVSSQAQAYPSKPIRLVVPFAPGGAADILGRIVADRLQHDLGQPVVIINKEGAGTVIGVDFVAKSVPDGYTLLMGNDAMTINTASGRKLPYDLLKDMAPISLVYSGPQIVLTNKSSPFNQLSDLVSFIKANPNKVSYGTSGIGSSTHLSTAALCEAAGINPTHVAYRGIAPAINDLLGGHVEFLIAGSSSALPLIRAGSAKPLAILSKKRSPLLPTLPTAIEQGVNAESEGWYGVLAPAGTPPEITAKLNATLVAALGTTEFRDRLLALAGEPRGMSEAQFSAFIRAEIQKFSTLMRVHDIQLK